MIRLLKGAAGAGVMVAALLAATGQATVADLVPQRVATFVEIDSPDDEMSDDADEFARLRQLAEAALRALTDDVPLSGQRAVSVDADAAIVKF